MKTKKLFTSLAAAVMLSTSLAGGAAAFGQTVHAADTTQTVNTNSDSKKSTIGIKYRSVSATINDDKPILIAVEEDGKTAKNVNSDFTKGQTIQVFYAENFTQVSSDGSESKQSTAYYIGTQTIDGKKEMIFIPDTYVTPQATVPSKADWAKQLESDTQAIQDAYKNRDLEYIVVTAKSKKGAKIYYAYKKTAKSKKVYFKASHKKIKHGKNYKSSMIVKKGKTRYVYIGKKRYVKQSALKVVDAKYAPVNLPDDLKNLVVENNN